MSKTMKGMMIREYQTRLEGFNDAAVISIRGVSSNDTNKLRAKLRDKKIKISMVRNTLAMRAFEGTGLTGLAPIMQGANALAYGGASVVEIARELVKLIETMPLVELKGAVLDGQLFQGKKGVEELSKFPTREEALGQTVTLLLGPARKLAAQIKGPGSNVAGLVKAIEAKLEKGEAIAKLAG